MKQEHKEILYKALGYYGFDTECIVAIEEMAELTKELCKYRRSKGDLNHIAEEIADVTVMLEHLKAFFNLDEDVENFIEQKVDRLKNRMINHND